MGIKDLLVSGDEAMQIYSDKKSEFLIETISKDDLEKYEKDGYELFSELKTKFKVRKKKDQEKVFENKVWSLFYKMGYTYLNRDSHCDIEYMDGLTKQIDVFAADDETILIVECKSSNTFQKNATFKENLESYYGMKQGLISSIQKEFGKKKVLFIYATNNYEFGEQDKERCKQFGIIHFNEDSVSYYSQLVEHLGSSAKYQLLGTLLKGQKITSMNLNVPAIQGKMGGHTYYSFLIEPSKLLKIGFVLHRNNAYSSPEMMPTYQRLIKKERLKAIREFVNEGGYFPNSIIISIDAKNPLVFDKASQDTENNISRMGTLHLPQVYQCAYIIDGQHRLYGYSESKYAETNTIPVIAFENLEKEEQVKMFMDINENQKQVPKQLRNTLEIDLLWTSKKDDLKRRAIMLAIADKMGEEKRSPFYGRVITGENQKTAERTLTLENLKLALNRSGLFNSYKSGQIFEEGLFDFNDSNKTYDYIYSLCVDSFDFIKETLIDEWNKSENGYLLTNNVIGSLIILLGDMIKVEIGRGSIKKIISTEKETYDAIETYLIGLCEVLNKFDENDIQFLKTQKGGSAPLECRKYIGWKLSLEVPEFNPEWLPEYIDNNCQNNHEEAKLIMEDLLIKLKNIFSSSLQTLYGDKWQSIGIPDNVYKRLTELKSVAERENDLKGIANNFILLDFANFDDYAKICRYRSSWSQCFKEIFATKEQLFGVDRDGVLSQLQIFFDRSKKNGNMSKDDFDDLNIFKSHIEVFSHE